MESGSIFKIEGKVKYLIYYSLIFLNLIILQSCTDSLGIDPKYQVEPAVSDSTLGNGSINQFSVDSILNNYMKESYIISGKNFYDNWIYPLNPKYVKSDIKLDTTNSFVKIWMNLDLTNPSASSQMIASRKDRLLYFKISFRALLENNKVYKLDGGKDSWKYSSVLIESVSNTGISSFKTYEGGQINSSIYFQGAGTKDINIFLTIDLSPIGSLVTDTLSSNWIIQVSNLK